MSHTTISRECRCPSKRTRQYSHTRLKILVCAINLINIASGGLPTADGHSIIEKEFLSEIKTIHNFKSKREISDRALGMDDENNDDADDAIDDLADDAMDDAAGNATDDLADDAIDDAAGNATDDTSGTTTLEQYEAMAQDEVYKLYETSPSEWDENDWFSFGGIVLLFTFFFGQIRLPKVDHFVSLGVI